MSRTPVHQPSREMGEITKLKPKGRTPGFTLDRRPSPLPEPLALRVPHAAHAIGISEARMWELIASGDVRVSRLGHVTLVHLDSLKQLLARTATPTEQPP